MKKLNNIKWFTLGIVVCIVMSQLLVPALAATFTKQATLLYNDIKITLNGTAVTPKDANGAVVEPFAIDGTTYLPVRAISDALGLGVEWDQATSTVKLTGASGGSSLSEQAQMLKVYNDMDKLYDQLLDYLFVISNFYSVYYLNPQSTYDNFESMYKTLVSVLVVDGPYERQIKNFRDSLNSMTGDRWSEAERSQIDAYAGAMLEAIAYMRTALDELYKNAKSNPESGESRFSSNLGSAYTRLRAVNDFLDPRISSTLNKIISASAG